MVSNTPENIQAAPQPGASDDARNRRMRRGAQALLAATAAIPAAGAVSAQEAAFQVFTGPQAVVEQVDPTLAQATLPSVAEPEELPSVGATGSAIITIARNNTGSMSNDDYKVGALMVLLPDDAHAVAVELPNPGALPECPEGAQCFTPLEFVRHVEGRVKQLGQATAAFMRPIEAALEQAEGPSTLLETEDFGENPNRDFGSARRWFEQTMINAERGLDVETFAASVSASEMRRIEMLHEEIGVELQMLGMMRGGIHDLQFRLDSGMLVPEGRMPGDETQPDPIRFESGPDSEAATQLREASLRTEPAAPAPDATRKRTLAA
ncbi:MAG: hypothetical protein AAF556_03080 [Pseudomonadota bacterium]